MNSNPSLLQAPASLSRVRLDGTLDMVQASDNSFRLILADGRTIPGRLGGYPILGLARLLGRPLLVFGIGRFGSGGELEGIEADGFMPNDGQLWVRSATEPPLSEEVSEEMARRLQSVLGTWPGDETDEQIAQALKELG
jgi:hypothetical protein